MLRLNFGPRDGTHQRAKLALVFPGERGTPFSGWSKAKSALDTASGVSGWWLHDLRRTLATGLQRLGVRLEVNEAALNHLSGSRAGVVGIYQRHDWAVRPLYRGGRNSVPVRLEPKSPPPKPSSISPARCYVLGRFSVFEARNPCAAASFSHM
jgi:hypothetical protein